MSSDTGAKLFIYSIIGFFAGLYFFFKGFSWMRQKKLIESIPTSKIRSLAMGLAEIYGEAVPQKNKLLKSPFSGKDCVYYKYTIEEYRSSGKRSRWVTIKEDECRQHFYLKDDTGFVLVDPKGATIDIPVDFEHKSGFGKDPNIHIRQFLKSNSLNFEGFLGMNKSMRYRECFIAPKDKLYILGTACDNPFFEEASAKKGFEDVMMQKGRHEDFYYISDKHEKDVLNSFKWKVIGGLYGGGALTVVCLAVMLLYLGLL